MPNQRLSARGAWSARAAEYVSWSMLGPLCRLGTRRLLRIETVGLSWIPRRGAAILACRHYHYLYDGVALISTVPRRVSLMVALDWVRSPTTRKLMAAGCGIARFPVVMREGRPGYPPNSMGAYRRGARDSRLGARTALNLLRDGRVLAIFPEGYPTIDPIAAVKTSPDEILPFRSGFVTLAAVARRQGLPPVPIIPVGLRYREGKPWRLTIRFGAPLYLAPGTDRRAFLGCVEARVRELSRAP
ncbi:MAG TPA: 1-acyl-sn-glycerol-3-phosphate acyltransferase [Chloroflexota bacterium]|nr:1-acyl-sn-glycerol-3-phosphate acyltransferase [Chloroflexota bacterium]